MSTPGLFIAFEGGEGAGKSTQSSLLESRLRTQGHRVVLVREPGSTGLGDYLRAYLVSEEPIVPMAELLLFEASRAQLVTERVRPLLEDGAIVITDRFAGSTVAYQGHGRGMDLNQISWLNDVATEGLYPDLTILLDVDTAVGLGRANRRQLQMALPMSGAPDRFEDQTSRFHEDVRRGFLAQAEADSDHWLVVDANRSIDEVSSSVSTAVSGLLASRSLAPGQ